MSLARQKRRRASTGRLWALLRRLGELHSFSPELPSRSATLGLQACNLVLNAGLAAWRWRHAERCGPHKFLNVTTDRECGGSRWHLIPCERKNPRAVSASHQDDSPWTTRLSISKPSACVVPPPMPRRQLRFELTTSKKRRRPASCRPQSRPVPLAARSSFPAHAVW